MGSGGRPSNAGKPAMAAAMAMSWSELGVPETDALDIRGVSGDALGTRPRY